MYKNNLRIHKFKGCLNLKKIYRKIIKKRKSNLKYAKMSFRLANGNTWPTKNLISWDIIQNSVLLHVLCPEQNLCTSCGEKAVFTNESRVKQRYLPIYWLRKMETQAREGNQIACQSLRRMGCVQSCFWETPSTESWVTSN